MKQRKHIKEEEVTNCVYKMKIEKWAIRALMRSLVTLDESCSRLGGEGGGGGGGVRAC